MTPGTQGCSTVTVPPPWCPQTQPPVLPSTCLWLFTAQDFCPCWLWEWFLGDWNKSSEGREVFQCSEQRQSCWGCTLRNAGMASLAQDELQLPKGFFFLNEGSQKLTQNLRSGPSSAQDKGWSLPCLAFLSPGLICSSPGSFCSFPAVPGRINNKVY